MTDVAPETVLMTQAARLYFDRQQSKVDIAAALGISRFRVARLISQALDDGLVRIEYCNVAPADRSLAAAIEAHYDLDLCVVAGGSSLTDVAREAAAMVDGLLGPGDVVGIAWGTTLGEVVSAMPARREPSVAVVQLAGNAVGFDRAHDPAELARLLAERWGAGHHPLFAPAFVDGADVRDALLRQPDVAPTVALFERLTMAIVGIGAFGGTLRDPAGGSSLVRSGALPAEVVDELVRDGVVGDVLLHPVTADGRFPATALAARAVGISVEGLREVPRVIAVAVGAAKSDAIRGALRSGLVRILVTDVAAAQAIAPTIAPRDLS